MGAAYFVIQPISQLTNWTFTVSFRSRLLTENNKGGTR